MYGMFIEAYVYTNITIQRLSRINESCPLLKLCLTRMLKDYKIANPALQHQQYHFSFSLFINIKKAWWRRWRSTHPAFTTVPLELCLNLYLWQYEPTRPTKKSRAYTLLSRRIYCFFSLIKLVQYNDLIIFT